MITINHQWKKSLCEDPFYSSFIEKPVIKPLTNKKLLNKLLFYESFLEEPNTTKYSKVFKNYARSDIVEVLNSQDLPSQLNVTRVWIKQMAVANHDAIFTFCCSSKPLNAWNCNPF